MEMGLQHEANSTRSQTQVGKLQGRLQDTEQKVGHVHAEKVRQGGDSPLQEKAAECDRDSSILNRPHSQGNNPAK